MTASPAFTASKTLFALTSPSRRTEGVSQDASFLFARYTTPVADATCSRHPVLPQLQGLSTEGWFEDYMLTEEGIEVTNGFLANIDLVSIPSDRAAKFRNTKIEIEEKKEEEFPNNNNILKYL